MPTSVNITTEGDSRQFVEQNPDKAVKLMRSGDEKPVYHVSHDGEFTVVLVWDDGTIELGPILGDDYVLDEYDVEIVDADEVPVETAIANSPDR